VASQAVWAQTALNMYPGYTGPRPRIQVYHGAADTTLYPQNYNETIKQWTGVFGYSLTPQQVIPNNPASPFTKYVYGQNVQGIYGQGVGHSIPIFGTEDLKWFGIIVSKELIKFEIRLLIESMIGIRWVNNYCCSWANRNDSNSDSDRDLITRRTSTALGSVRRNWLEQPNPMREPMDVSETKRLVLSVSLKTWIEFKQRRGMTISLDCKGSYGLSNASALRNVKFVL
jgi:hypothetical protein